MFKNKVSDTQNYEDTQSLISNILNEEVSNILNDDECLCLEYHRLLQSKNLLQSINALLGEN